MAGNRGISSLPWFTYIGMSEEGEGEEEKQLRLSSRPGRMMILSLMIMMMVAVVIAELGEMDRTASTRGDGAH